MDSYLTVPGFARDEFIERRSRFIGSIRPVTREEDAIAFINQHKSDYWDATHNVYAYVLRDGQTRRYSDDGEPQGTAGVPVLDVLLKANVTDVVVVVTRYFGGILLGAGGLVRAYSHAAGLALNAAGILTMRRCSVGRLTCDYNQYGRIQALIPSHNGVIEDTQFGADVALQFFLPCGEAPAFERQLADLTCGSVTAEFGEKIYRPFQD